MRKMAMYGASSFTGLPIFFSGLAGIHLGAGTPSLSHNSMTFVCENRLGVFLPWSQLARDV